MFKLMGKKIFTILPSKNQLLCVIVIARESVSENIKSKVVNKKQLDTLEIRNRFQSSHFLLITGLVLSTQSVLLNLSNKLRIKR